MSLWSRKGVLVCVSLAMLCLFLSLYATRRQRYCHQQADYMNAEGRQSNVEIAPAKPDDRAPETPERPSTLPPQNHVVNPTRMQVVKVSNKWNVFDTHSSVNYTIVVETYKRNDLLKRFITHYNHKSFPHLERMIIVWNNVDTPLQPTMFQQEIALGQVPVKFIVSKVNTMRNKMRPYPEIQTTAVLLIDDDLLIAAADIEFAFQTWQQFPQRIIGFVPRKHVFEPDGIISYGDYNWKRGVPNAYSMVLTGACFVHVDYLKMFDEAVPPVIHDMIDRTMNCDDLAMNVMVGDYLAGIGMPQPSCIHVAHKTPIQYIGSQARSGFRGLSEIPDHRKERFGCLKLLNNTYHGLPLPFSNLIVSKMKS